MNRLPAWPAEGLAGNGPVEGSNFGALSDLNASVWAAPRAGAACRRIRPVCPLRCNRLWYAQLEGKARPQQFRRAVAFATRVGVAVVSRSLEWFSDWAQRSAGGFVVHLSRSAGWSAFLPGNRNGTFLRSLRDRRPSLPGTKRASGRSRQGPAEDSHPCAAGEPDFDTLSDSPCDPYRRSDSRPVHSVRGGRLTICLDLFDQ